MRTTSEDRRLLWNGAEGFVEVGEFFQRFLVCLHGSVCTSFVKQKITKNMSMCQSGDWDTNLILSVVGVLSFGEEDMLLHFSHPASDSSRSKTLVISEPDSFWLDIVVKTHVKHSESL